MGCTSSSPKQTDEAAYGQQSRVVAPAGNDVAKKVEGPGWEDGTAYKTNKTTASPGWEDGTKRKDAATAPLDEEYESDDDVDYEARLHPSSGKLIPKEQAPPEKSNNNSGKNPDHTSDEFPNDLQQQPENDTEETGSGALEPEKDTEENAGSKQQLEEDAGDGANDTRQPEQNSQPKESSKETQQPGVTFANIAHVKFIRPHRRFTQDERAKQWIDRVDLRVYRDGAKRDAQRVRKTGRIKKDEVGLEYLATTTEDDIFSRAKVAVRTVLNEQKRQRGANGGDTLDGEKIAVVEAECSELSKQNALRYGESVAAAVKQEQSEEADDVDNLVNSKTGVGKSIRYTGAQKPAIVSRIHTTG